MKKDLYGQIILSEDDLVDLLMKGRLPETLKNVTVDDSVNLTQFPELTSRLPGIHALQSNNQTVQQFDKEQQSVWHMPDEYRRLDIAAWVLAECQGPAELQRCGHELLLYQEHGLFDLLRYLKYLVDTMREHKLIWGVGRGSSVSSFVLFKLGVHRINSLYYDLPVEEFLR